MNHVPGEFGGRPRRAASMFKKAAADLSVCSSHGCAAPRAGIPAGTLAFSCLELSFPCFTYDPVRHYLFSVGETWETGNADVILVCDDLTDARDPVRKWNVTWGGGGNDYAYGVAYDPTTELLYVVGYTGSTPKTGTFDALVLTYNTSDALSSPPYYFAVNWYGIASQRAILEDVGIDTDHDRLYAVGKLDEPPSNKYEVLLLQYDIAGDGSLSGATPVTWGAGSDVNDEGHALHVDEDYEKVYIAGEYQTAPGAHTEAVLLVYAVDGVSPVFQFNEDFTEPASYERIYDLVYDNVGKHLFIAGNLPGQEEVKQLDVTGSSASDLHGWNLTISFSVKSLAMSPDYSLVYAYTDTGGTVKLEAFNVSTGTPVQKWAYELDSGGNPRGQIVVDAPRNLLFFTGAHSTGSTDHWVRGYNLTMLDDPDADLLATWEECEENTDPWDPDTDDDTLDDGTEVKTLNTDPTDPDSDDDALDDAAEGTEGTDPNDPDSDDDNIYDGFEVQYAFNPLSGADNETDADADGLSNVEEFQRVLNPRSNDTDADTLPDKWELDNGLNPKLASDALGDHDSDGVLTKDEYLHGTTWNDWDSDDDGMPDGFEITYALNPLNYSDARLDPDADGRINLQEYWDGTHPRVPDTPTAPGSPGGGTTDGTTNGTTDGTNGTTGGATDDSPLATARAFVAENLLWVVLGLTGFVIVYPLLVARARKPKGRRVGALEKKSERSKQPKQPKQPKRPKQKSSARGTTKSRRTATASSRKSRTRGRPKKPRVTTNSKTNARAKRKKGQRKK